MLNRFSVPGRRIALLIIICFLAFTLLHFLANAFFKQHGIFPPVVFPALTLFLIVFHIIIACFMLMKSVCNSRRLYLVPIACAFVGSALMMIGTVGSYPRWFLCDTFAQINYNDAAIFFFFRNLTMALLFNIAIILYHFRKRESSGWVPHFFILTGVLLFTVLMLALAWTYSSYSPRLNVEFIDNVTRSFTSLWRHSIGWIVFVVWGITLLNLLAISRLRNIFWYSGAFFCVCYMVTLSILLSASNSESHAWYHARLLETAATLFIIFVLLSDIFTLYRKSQQKYLISWQNAIRDPLTRLFNRSYFYDSLTRQLRAASDQQPVSVLVSDLDYFKRINDTFGHLQGDKVIQFAADVLQANARKNDVAARIGGEEFALLLVNTTAAEAIRIAERIREAVAITDAHNLRPPVTISVGVYTSTSPQPDAETCVKRADDAMYQAKRNGRNQVVSWTE